MTLDEYVPIEKNSNEMGLFEYAKQVNSRIVLLTVQNFIVLYTILKNLSQIIFHVPVNEIPSGSEYIHLNYYVYLVS